MFLPAKLATDSFHLKLHANMPHVMRLVLHLEGKQSVVFRDTSAAVFTKLS